MFLESPPPVEESPPPVELKRFLASSKNKGELQILSREIFKTKANETNDGGEMQGCAMFKVDKIITKKKQKSLTKEADSCLIQQT